MKMFIALLLLFCIPSHAKVRELYNGQVIIGACSVVEQKDIRIDYCSVTEDGSTTHMFAFREASRQKDLGSGFTITNLTSQVSLDLQFDGKSDRLVEIEGKRYATYYWVVPEIFIKIFSKEFDAEFTLYENEKPVVISMTKEARDEFTFISGLQ